MRVGRRVGIGKDAKAQDAGEEVDKKGGDAGLDSQTGKRGIHDAWGGVDVEREEVFDGVIQSGDSIFEGGYGWRGTRRGVGGGEGVVQQFVQTGGDG